jgi:hypothetical protein
VTLPGPKGPGLRPLSRLYSMRKASTGTTQDGSRRGAIDSPDAVDPQRGSPHSFRRVCFPVCVYGVTLSADPAAPTAVVARFPSGRFKVAATFSEFFLRYLRLLKDSTRSRFGRLEVRKPALNRDALSYGGP